MTAPPPRPPSRSALLARGALSGVLVAAAFPPLKAWPLALVGLLPLLRDLEALAAARRAGAAGCVNRGFAAAFGTGLALYGSLLWWIVLLDSPTLTIPWVRYPGTLAIVSFLALYAGAFGAFYVRIRATRLLPPWLAAGSVWTALELLRGAGELGFPWGTLGYAAVPFRPALQIAAAAGIAGLTFWIAAGNALLLPLLDPAGRTRRAALVAIAFLVLPPVAGAWRLMRAKPGPTVRVALVQPNVSNAEKWDPAHRASIFEALAAQTRQGAAEGARLVLWPETAAPCYLLKDREWLPWVQDLVAGTGVPLFTGVPDYGIVLDGEEKRVTYTNTGVLFDANGDVAGRMDKIRLVPFGERIPFSDHVPFLAHLDFGEADFLPGKAPVLFQAAGCTFGNLVCFEATYPDLVRDYANLGAVLLVNITNDSWFGAGSGAEQHKDMAVVRCVETGCGMARCANSGISAGVDPWGRTFGETGLFVPAVSTVDVPLRRGRTPYDRIGDWVGTASVIVAVGAVLAGFARRQR